MDPADREAPRPLGQPVSNPADPPSPVPDYLWPQRGALAGDDQRIAITTEEIRMLTRVLEEEQLSGVTLVTQREGSPWLELDVAQTFTAPRDRRPITDALATLDPDEFVDVAAAGRVYRFALWRYTCSVYRVGQDGAVEDDPFLTS